VPRLCLYANLTKLTFERRKQLEDGVRKTTILTKFLRRAKIPRLRLLLINEQSRKGHLACHLIIPFAQVPGWVAIVSGVPVDAFRKRIRLFELESRSGARRDPLGANLSRKTWSSIGKPYSYLHPVLLPTLLIWLNQSDTHIRAYQALPALRMAYLATSFAFHKAHLTTFDILISSRKQMCSHRLFLLKRAHEQNTPYYIHIAKMHTQ